MKLGKLLVGLALGTTALAALVLWQGARRNQSSNQVQAVPTRPKAPPPQPGSPAPPSGASSSVSAPRAAEADATADEAKLSAFDAWVHRLASTPPGDRTAMQGEGVQLARERRGALKRLIQQNPRRALERAVPMAALPQLPRGVLEQLETRLHVRAELRVYQGVPAPDAPWPAQPLTHRIAVLADGTALVANVYGRREADLLGTRNDMLCGVVVDNQFAVSDEPLRVLEAGERPDPAKPVITTCPVSGKAILPESRAYDPVPAGVLAVEAPELVVYLASRDALDTFTGWLYAEGGTGGPVPISGIVPAAPTPALGMLKVLFIPMTFADQNTTPTTESKCYEIMRDVGDFYAKGSYGKLTTLTTVTPPIKLPHDEAWYVAKDTSNGGTLDGLGLEHSHAREEARRMGYDYNDYNCTVVRLRGGPRAVGGWGGGSSVWIYGDSTGTAAHEIGHSMGLGHANYWDTGGTSAIGAGANAEYGDVYDVMGSGGVPTDHFNAAGKNQLKWLPTNYVFEITRSGTYRVHAFDQPILEPTNVYAVRIVKDAQRTYWGEVRQAYNGSSSRPWAERGLLLGWRFPNGGGSNLQRIDTTPGSPFGKDDAAIALGSTFSDNESGIHITTVNVSTNAPKYVDVVVNLGAFPGNHPPTLALSASADFVPTGATVTFTATAADPDGDPLAYCWQHFGDTSVKIVSPNSNVITRTFSSAGSYVVACTVSDMKGGSTVRHKLITVGNGNSRYRISGRVTAGGVGLANVIVTANGANGVITDADGYYVIPNLSASTYTMTPLLYGYTFSELFNNSVTVAPNFTGADFEAQALPVLTIAATTPAAAEAGPTAGRFTLTRTGDTSQSLTVNVNPAQGTATKSTDYSFSPDYVSASQGFSTFTIPEDQASLIVVVTPVDDTAAEGPETVTLQLGPGSGYLVGPASSATVTISDSDTILPKVSLTVTEAKTVEGSGQPASVLFTRTGSTAGALTVNYTVGGTATPGSDYPALPRTVTIPAGAASAPVAVTATHDFVSEPLETITLATATNAAYLVDAAAAQTTLSLIDADVQVVSVSASDSSAREVDLSLPGAQPDTGTFLITRAGDTTLPLTVYYALSGPTTGAAALHGVDFEPLEGSAVIPAGAASVAVTILPRYDALGEGREYVTLQLGAGPTEYELGINHSATVSIDDAPLDLPYVEVMGLTTAAEGSANGAFRLSVKGAGTNLLTLNYTISGTATAGADYTITGLDTNTLSGSTTVTLNNGTVTKDLTVTRINDALAEDLEKITLTLVPGTNYQTFGPSSAATLWLTDDEQPTVFVDAHSTAYPPSLSESGSAGSFYLSRTGGTTNALTVNFSLGGSAVEGTDYNAVGTSVTIPAGASGVDVTITPINDTLFEGAETIVLTLAPGAYGRGPAATLYLTDNETSSRLVSFAAASGAGAESAGTVNLPVNLSSAATGPVTVEYVVDTGARSSTTVTTNRLTLPYWVRVVRSGSAFSAFVSTDGLAWTSRGTTQTVAMSSASYVAGIAVASSTSGLACTAVVDQVSLTGLAPGGSTGALASLDVGALSPAGAYTQAAGVYTITAGGPDISLSSSTDAFRYLYFPVANSTNCTLTARVVSILGGNTTSKAGVMVRDSAATNVRHLSCVAAKDGTARAIYRTTAGGSAANSSSTSILRPYWVRLQRAGDSFTAGCSPDGAAWTQVGTNQLMALSTTVLAGLAVSAKSDGSLSTATFDHVTLTGDPVLRGRTVGFVNAQGTDSLADGVYTVSGSGAGIGGTEDECHFLAAPVTGDFTLTARVLTQSGGASAAQAGILVRETASYRARNLYLGSVANAGLELICRSSTVTTAFGVGVDYSLPGGTLTFNAGETTQYIPLTIQNDTIQDWDEQLTVLLRNANGAQIGAPSNFIYTIIDDDVAAALPAVGFSAAASTISESAGSAMLPVALSAPCRSAVTVDYAVTGGSATPGTDFVLVNGTLTFAPGETVQTLEVPLLNDAVLEASETVVIGLSSPAGAVPGSLSQHTLTIADDDSPVVTVAGSDTNAVENGDTGSFTFTRTGSLAGNLAVFFSRSGTAANGTDYVSLPTTVTIPDGQASATLTVTPLQDTSNEGNETVIVTLSSGTGYTVGSPSTATVTIADDDRSTVTIVATDATASETAGDTGQFTLTRTAPTNSSLTVNLTITGTAANGTDYTTIPATAVFSVGQASARVNVVPINDAVTEGPEQVVLLIASGSYYVGAESFATVTIADNDNPPTLLIDSPTAQGPLVASGNGLVVSAAVSDDGAPQPVALLWTQAAGPGTATFESPTSASSAVTFSADGAYVLRVTATDGQFTVSDQVTVLVGAAIAPADWLSEDLSPSVSYRGQSLSLSNVFTITGTGAGYGSASDAAHVLVRQVAGDGSVVARLNSLAGATNPLAGVTIRDTLFRGARRVVLGYTASSGLQFRVRTAVSTTDTVTNKTGLTLPLWLKLERNAATGVITGSYAADAAGAPGPWTVFTSASVTMDTNAVVGLTVTSSSASATATAAFDHVELTPTGAALLTEDAGSSNPTPGTYAAGANGLLTIAGSGGIDGGGYFVGRQYFGDFVVSAKLVSASSGATSAKSGLMIRESMDSGGFVFLGRIPTGSFNGYLWRALAGGSSGGVPSFTSSTRWMRLVRSGNKVTAFHAPDASGAPGTWIQIGQPRTVIMTTPVLVGLAVDNSGGTGLNTCVFSNLTVVPLNRAPIVDPGSVASCPLSPVSLNGTVVDDDFPTPPDVALHWSQHAGPAAATFANPAQAQTTVSLAASGDYTFRLQAADGSVESFKDLSFTGYATAYDAWAAAQWAATGGLNDPRSAPDADPDQDRIGNCFEWIFGGNPMTAEPGLFPQVTVDAQNLSLTFSRADAPESGAALTAQWGFDLATWFDLPIGPVSSGPDAHGARVTVNENGAAPDTVVVSVPRTNAPTDQLFLRLQAAPIR